MTGPAGAPATVAAAYSAGGAAWAGGPARIYGRLAELLVAESPVSLAGRTVLDVGSGTGVASHALHTVGADVVALDAALGMLQVDRPARPPGVVGDVVHLPVRSDAVDGVVAAYVYNHLEDPVPALRDAGRVTRAGGPILAATYAKDDTHPVRDAVDRALAAAGYEAPAFYRAIKERAVVQLATVDRVRAAADAAGLTVLDVSARKVPFPDLGPDDLLAWRFGMAQHAWFVDALEPARRDTVVAAARDALGAHPPVLVRSVIHLVAAA